MKKLLAIFVVAVMVLSLMPMTMSAATADWVVNSVEGTAVIDGVKDEAYDAFEALVFETCGEGSGNGGGATLDTPLGYGYIMNDADFVYFFMDVHDSDMDNTSANNYERDSVEIFFMDAAALNDAGNPVTAGAKVQWRVCYDGDMGADSGIVPVANDTCVVKVNDDGSGYVVEGKFPITEVLNNQIEMLLQINSASGGARSATVYASGHPEGDNGYQRNSRDTTYDCWMTLALAGDHADTRRDPVEVPYEFTAKNYVDAQSAPFFSQLFAQDVVSWGWYGVGSGKGGVLGDTVDYSWNAIDLTQPVFDTTNTNDWTAAPNYAIQVSCNGILDTAGDTAHYEFSISDIVITADGYDTVTIPAQTLDCKWVAKEESWGISGTDSSIELGATIRDTLGLTVQQFCEEYIPAISNISYSVTLDKWNLVTAADVQAFVDGLGALEDAFINESLAEYTDRVNAALATASAEGATPDAIKDALDDATKAVNRARKDSENNGYVNAAYAHCDSLQAIVDQIQGLYDAAVAAQSAPAEEPVAADNAPADSEANAPADSASSSSEGGSSTGLIVGIIVVVVVIVVVVAAILLGKKKK